MELVDKLRKILSEEYDINSDEELLEAIDKQEPLDVGIFTRGEARKVEKVG